MFEKDIDKLELFRFVEIGDLVGAEGFIDKLDGSKVKEGRLYFLLAEETEKRGDLESAIRIYEKNMAFFPEDKKSLKRLAKIATEINNDDLAEDYYTRLTSDNSADYDDWQDFASLLTKERDLDRSIRILSALIDNNPKDDKNFELRGTAFFFKGDYVNAVYDFKHALQLNNKNKIALNNLIAAYFGSNNPKAGSDLCYHSLTNLKWEPTYLHNITTYLGETGGFFELIDKIISLKEIYPEESMLDRYLCYAYTNTGLEDEAKELLADLKLPDPNEDLHLQIKHGEVLCNLDKTDKALEFFLGAYKQSIGKGENIDAIGHSDISAYISNISYHSNDITKAVYYAKESLQFRENNTFALITLFGCYLSLNDKENALGVLKRMDELVPFESNTYEAHALYCIETGEFFESISYLLKIKINNNKNQNSVVRTVKRLYEKMDGFENAIDYLNRFMENSTDYDEKIRLGNLLVVLLDEVYDQSTSEDIASKVTELITKMPGLKSNLLPFERRSSHRIFRPISSTLSKNLYILKTSDDFETKDDAKKRLENEYMFLKCVNHAFAQEIFDKDMQRIFPQAVSLIEKDNIIYFYQRYLDKPDMEKFWNVLSPNLRLKGIIKGFENLAYLDYYLADNMIKDDKGYELSVGDLHVRLDKIDLIGDLLDRLVKTRRTDRFCRLGDNNKLNKFIELYSISIEQMSDVEMISIRDFYPGNLLINGSVIDFEKVAIGNPAYGLTSFLERPGQELADKNLVLSKYFGIISLSKHAKYLNGIMKDYQKYTLHNSIVKIGSNLGKGNMQRAQQYLEMTMSLMQGKLKDAFIDYLVESKRTGISDLF